LGTREALGRTTRFDETERFAAGFLDTLLAATRFDSAFLPAATVTAGPVANMHPTSRDTNQRHPNNLPNANTSTSNSLANPV
jgi:hypothetical protein